MIPQETVIGGDKATMNHPAVKAYRDTFRFCPSAGRRRDIVLTVENQRLWEDVLCFAKRRNWHPLKIQWMLSEYEERERDQAERLKERR